MGDIRHGGHHLLHLLAADGHLLARQAGVFLGVGGRFHILLSALGKIVQRGIQLFHCAGLLCGALSQGLSAAGKLLRVFRNPAFRLLDAAHGLRQHVGEAVDRLSDGAEIADIGGRSGNVKIPLGKLTHNAVDITVDELDRLFQRARQIAQLIVGAVIQLHIQLTLLKGLNLLGDMKHWLDHVL